MSERCKIVSDGRNYHTHIFVGDKEISQHVQEVTWKIGLNGVAEVWLKLVGQHFDVELEGEITEEPH